MSGEAARVVEEAIIEWLERSDIDDFCEVQRLEEQTRIWQYGKWCGAGLVGPAGPKAQIPYRASRSAPTFRDSVARMADDEAMQIHAAIVQLSGQQREVVDRVYVRWEDQERIPRLMGMSRQAFFELRKEALRTILAFLGK